MGGDNYPEDDEEEEERELPTSPATTSPQKRLTPMDEPTRTPPRKMLLRQSSTAPVDPLGECSPLHSPDSNGGGSGIGAASQTPANELEEFRRRLCDPVGQHFTTVEYFQRDGAAALGTDDEPVVPIEEVINMEPVFALFDEHIKKPMANPVLSRCDSAVLCVEAPPGVGLRTAVRSYCAQSDPQYRCNLITYRYFSPSELAPDYRFFSYLFALARTLTPCVVLIHRPVQRLTHPPEAAPDLLARIYAAYIQYSEQRRGARLPPFWLVFADFVSPGRVFGSWSSIDKRAYVGSMSVSQKQDYVRRKIAARLSEILLDPQDVQYQMTQYTGAIKRVVEANPHAFSGGVRDLNTYVSCLFNMPPLRMTEAQLRAATHHIDPEWALPSVALSDFDSAVQGIVSARESEKAKLEARQAAENARAQAEMQHIIQHFH